MLCFFSFTPGVENRTAVVVELFSLCPCGHCSFLFFPLAHSTTGKRSTSRVCRADWALPKAPPESFYSQHAASHNTLLRLLLSLHGVRGTGGVRTEHCQIQYCEVLSVGLCSFQKSSINVSGPQQEWAKRDKGLWVCVALCGWHTNRAPVVLGAGSLNSNLKSSVRWLWRAL